MGDEPAGADVGSAAATLAAYLWALPTTLLGLLVAVAASLATGAGRSAWRLEQGVIEVTLPETPLTCRLPFVALALGHVVTGVGEPTLARLRSHERVHVRQAERWGPLLVPAYLLESAWQGLRGRRPYLDNRFEVQARDRAAPDPGTVPRRGGWSAW